MKAGSIFGLSGESGSGKSMTGRLAIRLLEPSEGSVIFNHTDISHLTPEQLRSLRREMQVLFQDPFASRVPRMSIGAGIAHS